ncbi:MAG: polyphosphate polymerase domain-containing protein [Pseudomonadota bacterium]
MSQPVDIGRFELKYCVPEALRPRVLELARGHMAPDKHAFDLGDGMLGYEVHSLYLDTPRLDDLRDRLDEHKVRDRLRLRTYGPPEKGPFPVFLENKRKLENWVIKHRTALPTDSARFCATGGPEPWLPLIGAVKPKGRYAAEHFVRLTTAGRRRPVSVVHYAREVFVGLDPDRPQVRLTMDHQVTATTHDLRYNGLYQPPDVALIPAGWMVLELKFGGSKPGWMRHLCRELGLRACPVSKFGLSVAMGVAGNRYRAVRFVTPRPLRRLGYPPRALEVQP